MDKRNLYKETMAELELFGKTINDIEWVGIEPDTEIPLATFIDIADNEYDSDYGTPEVNSGLIVVGKDWWLERNEYDGAEWWDFKALPKRPSKIEEVKREDIFWRE